MGTQESAASDYRYLCTSIPSACEYVPAPAPSLKADVCWDGSAAFLMPAGGCPTGQWPFYIQRGEIVDPVTNQVQAYIPLYDACDMGFCEVKPPGAGPTEPGPMCCSNNGCTNTSYDDCTGANEILVWC
ncbi:MAG: hypothetical protein R6X02_31590, partial [Enhygromyxa sp.]